MKIYPALKLGMATAALLVATAGQVRADLLTFDDIPGGSFQNGIDAMTTYKGYEFRSPSDTSLLFPYFQWLDAVDSPWANVGAKSGDFAIINGYGGVHPITQVGGGDFTFDGMWAKLWGTAPESGGDSLPGTLEGWNDGVQVWSINTSINGTYAYFGPQAGAIDELRLGFGNFFVADDINLNAVNAVPEPEIYAMMGFGLGVLGWVGRRRKQQAA